MTEFSKALRELRLSPSSGSSDDEFVARVMAACASAPATVPSRKPAHRTVWMYGALAAAAACVAIGVTARPPNPPHAALPAGETIAARGQGDAGLAATVQAFVGHAAPGSAPPLLEGALLHPGDGILVRYSNPKDHETYLMVFALDQQRTVHWLHPAYLDESSNPTSLRLAPRVTEQVLSEVAEPENPAPGALHVYALLSATALDVKSVERRLGSSSAPVAELFPQTEVEEWSCTWSAQ